jgi:hypothetical protein
MDLLILMGWIMFTAWLWTYAARKGAL